MKKTTQSVTAWWDYNLLIGALSMLVILLTTEVLFSVPSRWLHHTTETQIGIGRIEQPKTNLSLDENPAFCTKEYMPVCGSDGKTYANKCMANIAKAMIVSSGECREETRPTDTSLDTPAEVIPSPIVTDNTPTITENIDYTDTGKYHIYTNNSIGYTMAFPKYSWYQGYGARDGAIHSMAMALDEVGVASFDSAPVRVWFYRTKPIIPPSDQSLTLAKGIIYVSSASDDPKIQKIVSDIFSSAR